MKVKKRVTIKIFNNFITCKFHLLVFNGEKKANNAYKLREKRKQSGRKGGKYAHQAEIEEILAILGFSEKWTKIKFLWTNFHK